MYTKFKKSRMVPVCAATIEKRRYECARTDIIELEEGVDKYKAVREAKNGFRTTHVLTVSEGKCSCGVWNTM
jgi:hypothetical protein